MASEADTLAIGLSSPPTRMDRPALFLDLDGVLAPLASTPDAVVPDARRTAVLKRLDAGLQGRMAIISGRTIAEIDRIAEASARAASGIHGLERRRRDGSLERAQPSPAVRNAASAFNAFAETRPGVLVEDKGLSVGLHYRGAPEAGEAAETLARRVAAETGLAMQPGSLIFELKTPGADKGSAVAAFMKEAPFAGSTPVMLGDDLTDEYGFRAAEALGGFGVLVGPMRDTAARYRLNDVEAVLDWLEAVAEAGHE